MTHSFYNAMSVCVFIKWYQSQSCRRNLLSLFWYLAYEYVQATEDKLTQERQIHGYLLNCSSFKKLYVVHISNLMKNVSVLPFVMSEH